MKMTQFKVINRTTRKEQLLNASEVSRFFKLNDIREYAISKVKSNLDKAIDVYIISSIAVLSVILITKIILTWI
tara:strand:+ start:345 stop:566 length:222 start_codon:yes stop_codon:yes gene_type:complete